PTPSDASYEIGSITKQFTAAAVLLLAEEGKLDLDADLTDYLDFNTQGYSVPVRRLLDHTSGIKGYTEMPIFGELSSSKLPRDTLVRMVENEPFEFEPGTALIYNNSAYFLLGLIIEEVSGESYEDFIERRLFDASEMKDSYYCSETAVKTNRAHGYDVPEPNRVIRKRYLDHTWPYAAGSLCSTTSDLVAWNRALHSGELLSTSSYSAMTTPAPLEDGTRVRYAMGLTVADQGGHRVIAHGGGINGFTSDGRYYPDDDLIIVVLQNSTGAPGPGALGQALAQTVLGDLEGTVEVPFTGDLGQLTGSYVGPARGTQLSVIASVNNGKLELEMGQASKFEPDYRGDLTWTRGSQEFTFIRQGERIVELRFDSVSGHYVLRRDGL
ncbi:MAG TPA: class A beta-lactamase-related serine hydrolase, partial [Gemmatimonadetes bacterium]|nr:class A beta-lactamase-related serine hydrolase [Gemmatimonadota bacterium]